MSSKTEVRKMIEHFVYGVHEEVDPFKYLSPKKFKKQVKYLDLFGSVFKDEISDYALDEEWDLFDIEEKEIRRIFLFTKGIQEHMVIMSPDGQIPVVSKEIDTQLLLQVSNAINSLFV